MFAEIGTVRVPRGPFSFRWEPLRTQTLPLLGRFLHSVSPSPDPMNWGVLTLPLSFSGDHKQKFYWGHKEILIPVFKNMADAMKKHPEVDVLINFASLRSAYDSTMETMSYAQVDPGRWEIWVGSQNELLKGIHSHGHLGQRTWELGEARVWVEVLGDSYFSAVT